MDASILGGPEPEEAELVSKTTLMVQKINQLMECVFSIANDGRGLGRDGEHPR